MMSVLRLSAALCLAVGLAGCCHPKVTAVALSPWNRDEPEGIPFYLPKPLLVIAKNVRYIEEAKVGLTDTVPIPDGYDDQSKYGDINARVAFNADAASFPTPNPAVATNTGTAQKSGQHLYSSKGAPLVPGEAPSDGLHPKTFYTYQIVFVPDMAQKYGLKVKGGVGEIRAAMNLVNGWQFTGLGPYYMKDSSTAQNILAAGVFANLAGRGVGDVIRNAADLAGRLQAGDRMVDAADKHVTTLIESMQRLDAMAQPMEIPDFAEIHVYEPHVTCDGRMEWCEIVNYHFNRQVLGNEHKVTTRMPPAPVAPGGLASGERPGPQPAATVDADVAKAAVARILGVSPATPALAPAVALQAGERAAAPGGVQVEASANKEFNLFRIDGLGKHHQKPRPVNSATATVVPMFAPVPTYVPRPEGDPRSAINQIKQPTPQPNDKPMPDAGPPGNP